MNDYETLPREEQPPASLEERVVSRLREIGRASCRERV